MACTVIESNLLRVSLGLPRELQVFIIIPELLLLAERITASFKILTCHLLPLSAISQGMSPIAQQGVAPEFRVWSKWAFSGGPIALLTHPGSTMITVIDVTKLEPREIPSFDLDPDDYLSIQAKRMRIGNGAVEEQNDDETFYGHVPTMSSPSSLQDDVIASIEDDRDDLCSCAMGFGGQGIVGLGMKGTLWLWKMEI